MKHPQNKKARFLIGYLKGLKRAKIYNQNCMAGPEWVLRFSRKYRNHTTLCSKHCCGNPRRHFKKKTRKEYRFEEDMENTSYLDELEN